MWVTVTSLLLFASGSVHGAGLNLSESTKLGMTLISREIPRLSWASFAMKFETAVTASAFSRERVLTGM